MVENFTCDALKVRIYPSREEMGAAAAADIQQAIREVLAGKDHCSMIFAAAPSQREVLASLAEAEGIDWGRVWAYHMDEYVGLPADAPQGFANFLREALFDRVPFGRVSCLDSQAQPEEECARYAALLRKDPADLVVMGVGENGHIAFNDPHAARFDDPELVKIVELDSVCRAQQVHDGCFAQVDDVPKRAMTLTVPALCGGDRVFCIVPAKAKAQAVREMLEGPVEERCPASILRRPPGGTLYLDKDSASLLNSAPNRGNGGSL